MDLLVEFSRAFLLLHLFLELSLLLLLLLGREATVVVARVLLRGLGRWARRRRRRHGTRGRGPRRIVVHQRDHPFAQQPPAQHHDLGSLVEQASWKTFASAIGPARSRACSCRARTDSSMREAWQRETPRQRCVVETSGRRSARTFKFWASYLPSFGRRSRTDSRATTCSPLQ